MKEIKEFKVTLDSLSLNFSMQPHIPIIDGETFPMELVFVIEDSEGTIKPILMFFEKDEVVGILKELKRLTPLVKCFG